MFVFIFFFSSRRRHTRWPRDWSSDVCSSDLGAIVQAKPGRTTDVLVRGRTNALQIAGKVGGLKLMEVRRLAARGHVVTVIGDRQFWRLVAATSSRRKTNHRKRAGPS